MAAEPQSLVTITITVAEPANVTVVTDGREARDRILRRMMAAPAPRLSGPAGRQPPS